MAQMSCKVCGIVADLSSFTRDRSRPSGFRNVCKPCWAKRAAQERSKNPDKAREISRRSQRRTESFVPGLSYEEKRFLLDQIKRERTCHFCGRSEPVGLDFHHRDPDKKEFTVAQEIHKTIERLLEEVAKCEVVCAYCHRLIHANLLQF